MKLRIISILLFLAIVIVLFPGNVSATGETEELPKILAIGDSLCRGYRNGEKGFVGDLGLPYVNLAISGGTLSTIQSRYKTVAEQLIEADVEADIIIANGGVNDYNQNAPLGIIPTSIAADEAYFTDSVLATVLGGLEHLLFVMWQKYPTARKFFLLSHKTSALYTGGIRLDWTARKNLAGYTQTELFDAISTVCALYGVEIIDVFNESELNTADEKYLAKYRWNHLGSMTKAEFLEATANDWVDGDGIHPLTYGYLHGYLPIIENAVFSEAPKNPFADVNEDDYFCEPVLWAVDEGITTGVSAVSFAPNENCTRAQIVTLLWRANGSPESTDIDNPFEDVSKHDYYYDAVLWALEEGITTGLSDTVFGPNEDCTRGQVATFLWRSQGEPEPEIKKSPFSDVKRGNYCREAVLWAVENDITHGTGDEQFSPNESCTRGQIVTFLYRAAA